MGAPWVEAHVVDRLALPRVRLATTDQARPAIQFCTVSVKPKLHTICELAVLSV